MICFDCSRKDHASCVKREITFDYNSCSCQHKLGEPGYLIAKEFLQKEKVDETA
jgi:hypothetical protein